MKTEFKRVADQRLSGLTMHLSLVLRILMRTAAPNPARKVVFQ